MKIKIMNINDTLLQKQRARLTEYNQQTNSVQLLTMGLNGHEFITDGTYSSETFCALAAWAGADAVVNYTVVRLDGTEIIHSTVTLKDGGMPIYGIIKNLTVDSGTVCAYYGLNII